MPISVTVALQMSAMSGEQHFGSDSVWVTKTHFPFSTEKPSIHTVDKIIYISRNPIEVMPSFAGLANTGSHSLVPEKPFNEYTDFWAK